jgi:hypothetical protein
MAFRAMHAEWGAIFAHLPDLGCGQAWEAVWKARPAAPLVCDECRHRMFAKVSRNGLRFFAHAPAAPDCALALETLAHHMLKLELANAARDAGAHAEMEVRGPDGAWRADVLASDPGGTWRWPPGRVRLQSVVTCPGSANWRDYSFRCSSRAGSVRGGTPRH